MERTMIWSIPTEILRGKKKEKRAFVIIYQIRLKNYCPKYFWVVEGQYTNCACSRYMQGWL